MTQFRHKYLCSELKPLKIYLLIVTLLLQGCNNFYNNFTPDTKGVACPDDIKLKAYEYAELYLDLDTEYLLGGQDLARSLKLDCSGLLVNCYIYAVSNSSYSLLFDDARVIDMYNYYTIPTENPTKGDLIFMGDDDISHIAILEKIENGIVYFIDCTQKDINNDGFYEINGVTKRNYYLTDSKIKAFGIMKIKE